MILTSFDFLLDVRYTIVAFCFFQASIFFALFAIETEAAKYAGEVASPAFSSFSSSSFDKVDHFLTCLTTSSLGRPIHFLFVRIVPSMKTRILTATSIPSRPEYLAYYRVRVHFFLMTCDRLVWGKVLCNQPTSTRLLKCYG
jgi:hypothetical protein